MDMEYSSLATICCLRLLMSLLPTSIRDNQKFTDFSIQFLQHAYKIKKTVTIDLSIAFVFPPQYKETITDSLRYQVKVSKRYRYKHHYHQCLYRASL